MGIKNYLKKEKTHYTISLNNRKKIFIKLWEHIDGINKKYKHPIGITYTWRAEMLQKFLDRLVDKYHDDIKNQIISYQTILADDGFVIDTKKTHWNNTYQLNNEIAMKMLFSIKLVSSMHRRPRIEGSLEIIYSLTDEEITFWCWKVLSLKNRALNAFKEMYL